VKSAHETAENTATYGNRIVGSDAALQPSGSRAALCIGFTGDSDGIDCYERKLRKIHYDVIVPPPWYVQISDVTA
jgi:hypothetical protein